MKKLKNVKHLFYFCSVIFIGLVSCDKDNDSLTDVLDLLPEEFYKEMVDNGFVFNLGETPPNVEDNYDFEPINEYDNSDFFSPGEAALLTKWKFANQSGNKLDVFIKNWTGFDQVDESDATVIKGEGNAFTVIAQATGKSGEITYKYNYVLTGNLTAEGIQNAQFGFVMVDNPGAIFVAQTGTIRIFKDKNQLASKTDIFRYALNEEKDAKGIFSR